MANRGEVKVPATDYHVESSEQNSPRPCWLTCCSGISIFLSSDFVSLFCWFAFFPEDTHPSKCIMQKLRELKIPIWARAFVSELSIFQLSFSLFIFRTHIIVRFHLSRAVWNQNRSWDWAIRAERLGCTLTACIAGISEFLQRKNFWMNAPWEKMSVSVVIHSVKCFVQVNLFSIPCFPDLPHWSPNILSWADQGWINRGYPATMSK